MTILLCALLCVPMMGTLEVSAAVNVAAGKTAMASSYFGENYVPEMATDGDLNTAWSMGSEILTGKRGGYEYIGVDLGALIISVKSALIPVRTLTSRQTVRAG